MMEENLDLTTREEIQFGEIVIPFIKATFDYEKSISGINYIDELMGNSQNDRNDNVINSIIHEVPEEEEVSGMSNVMCL